MGKNMCKTFNMTWQLLTLMQEPPKILRRPLKCLQGKEVAIWGRIPKAKFFLGHPVESCEIRQGFNVKFDLDLNND